MAKTVLLTLGRLPKAIELSRGFSRLGCRVIVAEPFRWHLCRVSRTVDKSIVVTAPATSKSRYLDDLAAIIAREGVDLVVPVSEESMHVAGLRARVPDQVRIFAPAQQRLVALHDKHAFIRHAASLGLDVPPTAALDDPQAAAIARQGDFVVKPIFSCSGSGVRILARGSNLPASTAARSEIVQHFVGGTVHSSFSIAREGKVLATAIYRGTVMSGTVAVCFERVAEQPSISAWINRFVEGSRHTGFISFDFVVEPNGRAWAIECNPRVTSGIHFLEPEDIARAILDPTAVDPTAVDPTAAAIRFRPDTLFQQFYTCLTETQKSLFKPSQRRRNLQNLIRARDVVWDAADPIPFLTMTFTSYQILALSIFQGFSLGEAATRDIEWYDDAISPGGRSPGT